MRNFQVFGRIELGSRMEKSFATVEFIGPDIVVMSDIQPEGLGCYGFLPKIDGEELFPSVERAIDIQESGIWVTGLLDMGQLGSFAHRLYEYHFYDATDYAPTALAMARFVEAERLKRANEIDRYLLSRRRYEIN